MLEEICKALAEETNIGMERIPCNASGFVCFFELQRC